VESRVAAFPIASPHASASAEATRTPQPGVLPIDSTLSFILDGTISSATSNTNEIVAAHLRDPLVLEGTTIAPAGTPVRIRILDVKRAGNPDIYGFVDIYFYPMTTANGGVIPLRPPTGHLSFNVTAGHASTADVENTIGDVYAPTLLLHIFRKGRNFTLEPGATINARTQATVKIAPNGVVTIATPAPLELEAQTPHATFNAVPLATPAGGTQQIPVPPLRPGTPSPRP
jgi:hypothetical protein